MHLVDLYYTKKILKFERGGLKKLALEGAVDLTQERLGKRNKHMLHNRIKLL